MFHIMPYKRKKRRRIKEEDKRIKKDTPARTDGLWKEQTHGTTGSGNCSQDMKRRLRTILAWCSYHAVSSSTER